MIQLLPTLPRPAPTASATPVRWGWSWSVDELDVTITDIGLALEAAVFAAMLARHPTRWSRLRRWSVSFFGTATVASLASGTGAAC